MLKFHSEQGEISVSSAVFSNITGMAATNCFGVKGMAYRSMTDGLVHLLRREAMSKGVSITYHDDNSIHVVNPNEITARHLHLTHTPSQQIASLDQAPSPISKLLFEEEPQRLRQLEEAIRAQDWSREYEVVASAVNLLEITARGANKGGMVRRLAELLGVRQENVCCVGDHANDIPMLEYAGMAFAPENAIPAVHRVPGIHILPDCRENAMAAMIEILDRRYS